MSQSDGEQSVKAVLFLAAAALSGSLFSRFKDRNRQNDGSYFWIFAPNASVVAAPPWLLAEQMRGAAAFMFAQPIETLAYEK